VNTCASSLLPFSLRPFRRLAWTSNGARQIWEPRIARLRQSERDAWLLAVARGIAPGTLLTVRRPDAAALALKAEAHSLGWHAIAAAATGDAVTLAVGTGDTASSIAHAVRVGDFDAVARDIGVADCCREADRERRAAGIRDGMWNAAERTENRSLEGQRITLHGPPAHNHMLSRAFGCNLSERLPCAFDCPNVGRVVKATADVENEVDPEAAAWRQEMLGWSMSWSALHGIAEVRTPVAKVIYATDATATRFDIHYVGTSVPSEGAIGLTFPLNEPRHRRAGDSRQFHAGMEHVVQLKVPPPWHHLDNEFLTRADMRKGHDELLRRVLPLLEVNAASIADIGCGNALFLKNLLATRSSLIPYGIDICGERIAHAREVVSMHAAHFSECDALDILNTAIGGRSFDVALVFAGIIQESSAKARKRLLRWLQAQARVTIIYAYPTSGYPSMKQMTEAWSFHGTALDDEIAMGSRASVVKKRREAK